MFAGRKLMLAISILHSRGYGNLRLKAGMSPSGCHWRYHLKVPGCSVSEAKGSLTNQESFNWGDTDESSPEDLADSMVSNFPELLAAAKGFDPAYSKWITMIIEESQPEGLFIEYWDSYDGECDHVRLINCGKDDQKYSHAPAES